MSRIPAAVKAWRNPVVDAFNDNKFFALPLRTGQKWALSIKALFSTDKVVFTDLLGTTATIFHSSPELCARKNHKYTISQYIRK